MMKQVLVSSMRPKDGDTVSRLDRTGADAGTSRTGQKPPGRIGRSTGDERVNRGRATVFVSVWRAEDLGRVSLL